MSEKVTPITPDDVIKNKANVIPSEVIEVVNSILKIKFSGSPLIIKQSDVVSKLEEIGFDRHELYKNNSLDFENIYREAGWKVLYDKPAYNESYGAFWKFSRK